jgi:hypothetical protein
MGRGELVDWTSQTFELPLGHNELDSWLRLRGSIVSLEGGFYRRSVHIIKPHKDQKER